jgi:hypothetical protein
MSHNSIVREILSEAGDAPPDQGVPGFVAMQYYAGILNRTFAIFICSDGLYGWKFCGPVTNRAPGFFLPLQEMLGDPAEGFLLETVRKLAGVRGGFFIPRSDIAAVEFNPNPKWGMGGIPHSGRIEIKRSSGKRCEYILLGNVNGYETRNSILRGATSLSPS